jgi:putative inorganic carbon (hco3(-)) transporter
VWGPDGSQVADNNALSAALVMLMPFLYYLWQVSRRSVVRWFIVFSMVAVCFAILGSQSRGALVAVFSMATVLGLKSRHPFRTTIALAVLLSLTILFMPDTWSGRMNTIRDYQSDDSSMSRIYSWITMWNLALDRPLVGGGFRSDAAIVYQLYAPAGKQFEAFGGQYWVAHSIYFQMLGEHGFVGLGLFIILGVLTWRRAGQLARITRNDPDLGSWVPRLMPMVQVSLVGYAAGGAFLSLAYFDWPYYIVSYVVLVDGMVHGRRRAVQAAAAPPFLPKRQQPLDQV